MLIKVVNDTQKIYNLGQLRKDNPNTSFPKNIPESILNQYDVFTVIEVQAPDIDNKTHRHNLTFDLIDGKWTQVWLIEELSLEMAEQNVRAHRNRLLLESDWIVSVSYEKSELVPGEWITYRNALRDLPQQSGFPYSVEWPTKPL